MRNIVIEEKGSIIDYRGSSIEEKGLTIEQSGFGIEHKGPVIDQRSFGIDHSNLSLDITFLESLFEDHVSKWGLFCRFVHKESQMVSK